MLTRARDLVAEKVRLLDEVLGRTFSAPRSVLIADVCRTTRLFQGTGNGGMATSESDADFESADEELGRGAPVKRNTRVTAYRTTVDSESDDDTEYVQHAPCGSTEWQRSEILRTTSDALTSRETLIDNKSDKIDDVKVESGVRIAKSVGCVGKTSDKREITSLFESGGSTQSLSTSAISAKSEVAESAVESGKSVASGAMFEIEDTKTVLTDKEIFQTKSRDTSCQLDTKKLGTKLAKDNVDECSVAGVTMEQEDKYSAKCSNEKSLLSVTEDTEYKSEEKSKTQVAGNQSKPSSDLSEMDVPEELKSNKKFKEVFQPEGWEGLGDDIELPDELTEEKLQPVLQRLSLGANKEESQDESSLGSWGSWGNWGVTSFINTATASVSTLTSHVSQGLTLLEDTMGGAQELEKRDAITAIDGTIINSILFMWHL